VLGAFPRVLLFFGHNSILAACSQIVQAESGRGGGIRTPTRGFGDRWSAVKPTPLRLRPRRGHSLILLDFLVRLVLAAMAAELLHLEPLGGRLFVFGRGIIPVLALCALKSNDVAHFETPT